ncbi:hypothetical protein GCM10009601_00750 [Streptomyces thermospinosisporus]|uniref:Major facilitator superfamily (MFS) profile domain-containing protein n=1 Tax=Streptomyces thermospinosisporus TaxID=161482 RepID=A0ABN1YHL8_9ACTN
MLIAAEAVLSLVFRPVAGELSDRLDPRRVAAAGAALYALSFAGYALADGLPLAFVAAAVGGAGGALFWVALDTFTGRRAAGNGTAAYGELLTASGKGAFLGYAVAFTVLENAGYRPLFWAGCGACAVAAVLLARDQGEGVQAGAPSSETSEGDGSQRRLLPLMGIAAVTAGAEAGLWMLLLLRLQEEYGLTPMETGLVFAPGFIVFILLPAHAHRVTDRVGRSWTMGVSFAASALFAGGLAVMSGTLQVALLWALAAACFAAQIPVEQATVAEAAGERVGRAMGRYESARLVGILVGPPLFGLVFESQGWAAACLTSAAISLMAAAAAPGAIKALGLPERPQRQEARLAQSGSAGGAKAPVSADEEKAPVVSAAERARTERREWLVHTVVFITAQLVLWVLDSSWLAYRLQGEAVPEEHEGGLMWVGQIWLPIWIVDTLWSWSYTVFPRQGSRS